MKISDLKLTILPARPKCNSSEHLSAINQSYELFSKVWKKEYEVINNPEGFESDQFFRSDFVVMITYREEAVALMLGTKFNLKYSACLDHRYFLCFHESFMEFLLKKEFYNVVSLEACAVKDDFQKNKFGINLGSLIITLSSLYAQSLSMDGVIATIRADIPLHDKVTSYLNYQRVYTNFQKKGFLLDNIFLRRNSITFKDDPNIFAIKKIWKDRVDLTIKENQEEDIAA